MMIFAIRKTAFGIAFLTFALPIASIAFAQDSKTYELADLKALQTTFERLAEALRPSVAAIQTYQVRDPDAESSRLVRVPVSQGSGMVMDPEGHIVTNRHVLEDANLFMVTLADKQRYEARIVQTDPRSDLAVLKIEASNLTPVRWGDASTVKVGHWAIAVGNPFGFANDKGQLSVSVGTISAVGREMTHRLGVNPAIQYYGHLLETTAAVNPGHSGGPLFNLDGEVIGIITAIETKSASAPGAGFAIPVDGPIRQVLDTLRNGREVRYGYLGVSVEDVPPLPKRVADSVSQRGARVASVSPSDGPAGQAGLSAGDVVVEFNGEPIDDADHLVRVVGFAPVGTQAELVFLRKGVKRKATVTLADRGESMKPNNPAE